jgi:hypothetical protein
MNIKQMAQEVRFNYWVGVFRERSERGLSIRAWCRENGIQEKTYYYWQRKLRKAAIDELAVPHNGTTLPIPTGFAEIKVAGRDKRLYPQAGHRSQIRIEISGALIAADSEYPADKLVVVIKGLA